MKLFKSFIVMLSCYGASTSVSLAADTTPHPADNAFMMICTVLVLFMSLPGIALFYGGLIRGKNILSLMTQTIVSFSLTCVLWVCYGYSVTFSQGNPFFGDSRWIMLKNIPLKATIGSLYQYIHIAYQASFACITIALVMGALAERVKFSAILIFSTLWVSFSYFPIAHMVWGGGLLSQDGALDFAGGTVVHINAAVGGLVGAWLLGKRTGYGKEAIKPHNLPIVFTGTAILYIGWFGFNAGSAAAVNEIAALAFLNTIVASAAAVLAWTASEWLIRGKPSFLGACSGMIAGLVAITPGCGFVGIGGALVIGFLAGIVGIWGVTGLKSWLRVDDPCDVFGVHGTCGVLGCVLTGVFAAGSLGGVGYPPGITLSHQVWVQLLSCLMTILWSGSVALFSFKIADKLVGLRIKLDDEREGLDVNNHGENAYNL